MVRQAHHPERSRGILNFQFSKIIILINRVIYYFRIWWIMSKNSFLMVLTQKKVFMVFLLGKVLRFVFFFSFLFFLVKGVNGLAGYNTNQVIFFFLTFMLVDVTAQFLFREVYRFRPLVVTGDLDLLLVKPTSTLFRVLMGGADVIDFITIPPLYFIVYYYGRLLNPSVTAVVYYLILLSVSLLIATALHIIVLSFGVITLEVDHLVMIYRDLTTMGRFPVDIYKEPARSLLTYLIPVGIIMTVPAKALMGLISLKAVVIIIFSALLFFYLSLRFWKFALTRYSSASS